FGIFVEHRRDATGGFVRNRFAFDANGHAITVGLGVEIDDVRRTGDRARFRTAEVDLPFQRAVGQRRHVQVDRAQFRSRRTGDAFFGAVDPRLRRGARGQAGCRRRVQRHTFGQRDRCRFQLRAVDFGRAGVARDTDFGRDLIRFVVARVAGGEAERRVERNEVAVFESHRRRVVTSHRRFFGARQGQSRRVVARAAGRVGDERAVAGATIEDQARADQRQRRRHVHFEVVVVVAFVGAVGFLAPFDVAFDQRVGEVLRFFDARIRTFEDREQLRFGLRFGEFERDAELGREAFALHEVVDLARERHVAGRFARVDGRFVRADFGFRRTRRGQEQAAAGERFRFPEFRAGALGDRSWARGEARSDVCAQVVDDPGGRFGGRQRFTGDYRRHLEVGYAERNVAAGLCVALCFRFRFARFLGDCGRPDEGCRSRFFRAFFEAFFAVDGYEFVDAYGRLGGGGRHDHDRADEQREEQKADARPHTDLPGLSPGTFTH